MAVMNQGPAIAAGNVPAMEAGAASPIEEGDATQPVQLAEEWGEVDTDAVFATLG